jgi:hypothetical protein
MEQSGSSPSPTARTWRLRIYRLLANSFAPLFAVLLLTAVVRWTLPQLIHVVVVVWAAAALLILVIALPWLAVSFGFASGAIKCPSCGAAFAPGFNFWVPKICHSCGYRTDGSDIGATSNNRSRGP